MTHLKYESSTIREDNDSNLEKAASNMGRTLSQRTETELKQICISL